MRSTPRSSTHPNTTTHRAPCPSSSGTWLLTSARAAGPSSSSATAAFDTDWWHPDDWKALYDAVKPYNVILYLYGHSGTGLRRWKPQGEERPLTCVNTGQTENGFFVVQITQHRIRLAYRAKRWTLEKPPSGRRKRTWSGEWEWKHLLEKKLSSSPRRAEEARR